MNKTFLPSVLATTAFLLAMSADLMAQSEPEETRRLTSVLGRGLSPEGFDDNGWTDLHYAAAMNLPSAVETLLIRDVFVDSRLYVDGLPLTESLTMTLSQLERDFAGLGHHGQTALHVAAHVNALDAATILLEHGADPDALGANDQTPLHVAASRGHIDFVRKLAFYGADVNARTFNGRTPLHVAIQGGHLTVARELANRGADVESRTGAGYTPLHFAVRASDVHAARELTGRGADVNAHASLCAPPDPAVDGAFTGWCTPARASAGNGNTPLHEAAAAGDVPFVQELLRLGADVTRQDANRATAVHHAAAEGHLDAVRDVDLCDTDYIKEQESPFVVLAN